MDDLLSLWPSAFGNVSLRFAFLDYRGTRFHLAGAKLVRVAAIAPEATLAADNVLKPGAPLFLWSSVAIPCGHGTAWQMPEYLHRDLDDWMAVCH